MGLVIQHNTTAITAKNRMKRNVTGLKKASEKLSTGYQINRAADNASGLAVSEKMRSQIRGLSQATNNANDGISLIQTADGALGETHDILQRMRELSVQSANGTYTDEDRLAIQHEVDALKGELSRISESTEFNEVKLLDGTLNITVNSKVQNNEYGALYGTVCHGLAVGGGKISVTGSIAGMYIDFTTDASGKGGENAYWEYDVDKTDSELTQHVTVNLAKGEIYTDEDIQKIIDKATTAKPCDKSYGNITFKSETGFIVGAEATTYGIETGSQCQRFSPSTESIAKKSDVVYEERTRAANKSVTIVWDNTSDPAQNNITVDSSGTVHLNKDSSYSQDEIKNALINSGIFKNDNKWQDGTYVDDDQTMDNIVWTSPDTIEYPDPDNNISGTTAVNFSYSEKYEQAVTEYYDYYEFWLEANDYGSYDEYLADEEKYKQPDCYDDFNHKALKSVQFVVSDTATNNLECAVNNDTLIITLKDGVEYDSYDITTATTKFLTENGYNYSFKQTTVKNTYDSSLTPPVRDANKFIASSGSTDAFEPDAGYEGSRYIKRTGTTAGVRQVIEGSLLDLVGDGNGGSAIGSSDYITFTAKTYGKSSDYASLVQDIAIETSVGAGEEFVEVYPAIENAIPERAYIHLSTGVEYTDEDIEALLEKAGLQYDVTLSDKVNPDGDRDGHVSFNVKMDGSTSGSGSGLPTDFFGILIRESTEGKGVGFEDISVIKEGITFQIGANGTEDQQITMLVEDAGAEKLGVASLDVTTAENANKAIEKVDEAIRQISEQRAKLGALQNRLSHSVNSLRTTETNLTAAESQIRDTDIATEMITYTKNNILQQASQAMLSQANKQTEGILQLLG